MTQKRIAVLTLSFGEPRLMLAGLKDGMVHIIESKQLEPSLPHLKRTLPARLEKLRKGGFVVLVDEVIPHFAQFGRAVKLNDIDGTGKPIIVAAMQAYLSLSAYQAISFPAGAGGTFDVSPSVVEEVRGLDGKPVYNIDWPELKPDNVAMLLTVYAATQDSLFDQSTLTDVMKHLGAGNAGQKISNPFANIVKRINAEQLSVDALDGGKHE